MKPKYQTPRSSLLPARIALCLGLAMAGLASQSAQAANATWAGTTSVDWNTTTNWSATLTAGSIPTINSIPANICTITANPSVNPGDVFVGSGAGTTGRVDHRAGTLTQNVIGTAGNWFFIGAANATGTGTYNLADTATIGGALTGFGQGSGSLTIGKLWVGGRDNAAGIGTVNINTTGTIATQSTGSFASAKSTASVIIGSIGGTGTLNMDSGTINNASTTELAFSTANTQASRGTLNLGGGTFTSEGDFRLTYAGSAAATATVNVSGGTLNIASTTKRWLIVGQWDTTTNTITVNSGNLNLNTNTDLRMKINGGAGTQTVNLNGGAITSYSDNKITANGAGVVDLMNASSTATNTFNLNGGTLTIREVITNNDAGTAAFNFNGGTLKATGTTANFLTLGGAAQRTNVRDGGARIDSNGYNVTIPQALAHSNIVTNNPVTGTPDAAIDGGLTKEGAGTLTLKAATYTGATSVNVGRLIFGGTPSTSGLTVATDAVLSVEDPAATLGSLTVPTASFAAGAALDIETANGNFSEKVVVSTSGGLSFATLGVNLYLDGTTNAAFGGTYTLFEYTGSFTGNLANLSVLNPRPGYTYNFAPAGNTITVEVIAGDTDGDGMDDFYEQNTPGLNYLVNDASGNLDGDFATNYQEFVAGTDPNNPNQDPLDTDNDKLLDTWEVTHFATIAAQNATGDADGDLVTNLAEFTASTDPNNGNSWPDSDTDTMNDAWETTFLGSLALDGTADTDGDGYTDLQEHSAHTDPSAATGSGVSPIWANLKHRWSFNGDLTDSVGSSNATIVDVGANGVAYNDIITPTAITMTGGARAASDYVKLGENLLPDSTNPVTIELWARQNSIQNWSRIFDFHSGTTEYLMMAWTTGTNNATDRLEWRDSGTSLYIDNKNQPYGITDEHHLVVTLEPLAGAGGKTRVSIYSALSGAADLGPAKAVAETTINLVNFNDTLNALGYSPWPDNTANATYNEVRIWNGALFGWMREKLHDQGPDNAAIPDADGDRLPDAWETQYFSDTTTATALTGDNDGDTFTNQQEYVAGSNPNDILSTPEDMDADGLKDTWEVLYFGNITTQNGSGDPDQDGLTNEQEETAGSNPADDEDGLLAAWEIFFFGSTFTQVGADDSDGDGASNLAEQNVSQPNNINSTPTDVNGDGIADTLQHKLVIGDALGTTSFDTGLHWNDTLAPAAGETYIVAVDSLRTPPVDGNYAFAGNRLDLVEVYTGFPRLLIKGTGTITFPLITLSGGEIQHAATNGTTCRVAGAVSIRGPMKSTLGTPNGPLAMDAVISGSGNLELWGPNTVTFTAANTYSGNIKNGTTNGLILDPTGSLKFVPGATGVNNAISGTGPVTLNGALNIDLVGASSTIGDSWDFITTTGAVTIGSTFTVTGFSPTGDVGTRIWWSGSYRFDEASGVLSVAANPDSDSDGMADAWETTYFGGLGQGATGDYDADGTNNLTEYRLGLIPNSGTSSFAVTRNATTGQLTWPSKEGVTFRIERSTTLESWTALEAAYPATASPATTTSYTDAAAPPDKAFYRIGLNP